MSSVNIQIDPEKWIKECDYLYIITKDKVHLQQKMEIQRMLVEAHVEELRLELEKLKLKLGAKHGDA